MAGGKYFSVKGGSKKPLYMIKSGKKKAKRANKRPQKDQLLARNTSGFTSTSLVKRHPLSPTYKAVLPYFETGLSINPAAGGVVGSYVFQINGPYDPNVTGIGHQPLGFDQLMLMYEHYIYYTLI